MAVLFHPYAAIRAEPGGLRPNLASSPWFASKIRTLQRRRATSDIRRKARPGGRAMANTSDVNIDRKALLLPAAAPLYETLAPFAYTLIRVALGLILVPHGFAKLFQGDAVAASRNFVNFGWAYPLAWAYFIGALEFFGGLMLAVGLFTRVVALAFVIEMAVISFGVLYPNWSWGKRGMEYALFMGVVALAIFLRGGGRYSLDRLIGREF